MTNHIQLLTTAETNPDAQAVANTLVACVRIIGPLVGSGYPEPRKP